MEYIYHKVKRLPGIKRYWQQMKMLIKAKCFVENRTTATIEDFDYFKLFYYGTTDFKDRAKRLETLEWIPIGDKKHKIAIDYEMFDTQSSQKTKNMEAKLVYIDFVKDFNYIATLTRDKSEIFAKFKDGFEKTVFPSLKTSINGYRRIINILEKELKKGSDLKNE